MFDYQKILKIKMDKLAHLVYKISKQLPSSEKYGLISQITRAAVSVILNYIEGYARIKINVRLNFLEISYGSLKETQYLLYFLYKENMIGKADYDETFGLSNEIGAMLWTEIKNISEHIK